MTDNFDNSKIELLIDEVKQRPCIWDKNCREYRDARLREIEWKKISMILEYTSKIPQKLYLYLMLFYFIN